MGLPSGNSTPTMGTSGSTALPGWNYQSGPMPGAQPTNMTTAAVPATPPANPLGNFANAFPTINPNSSGGQFVWGTPTAQSGLPYGGMRNELTVPGGAGNDFYSSIYSGGQRPDFNSFIDRWRQHQQAMAMRPQRPMDVHRGLLG